MKMRLASRGIFSIAGLNAGLAKEQHTSAEDVQRLARERWQQYRQGLKKTQGHAWTEKSAGQAKEREKSPGLGKCRQVTDLI
jgi:hypothetical protein